MYTGERARILSPSSNSFPLLTNPLPLSPRCLPPPPSFRHRREIEVRMAWTGMSRVLILHRKMSDTHRQVPLFLSSCVDASSCVSICLSVPRYIGRHHVCDSFPRKGETPDAIASRSREKLLTRSHSFPRRGETPDAIANMCASTPRVTLPMKRSWSCQ